MRAPFHSTSPAVGVSKPHRMRSRLVLPLPFAPATRSVSPGASANASWRKSFFPPRSHSRSRASSTGGLLQKLLEAVDVAHAEPVGGLLGRLHHLRAVGGRAVGDRRAAGDPPAPVVGLPLFGDVVEAQRRVLLQRVERV